MTQKFLFCLKKEHQKLGGLPLTVFKYLIWFQSYDHSKKFYPRQVVTSSFGHENGLDDEMSKSSAITAQNRLNFVKR